MASPDPQPSLGTNLQPSDLKRDRIDWDTFKDNVNEALKAQGYHQPLTRKALLLRWEESDLGHVVKEVRDLGNVLQHYFGFDVEIWLIPNVVKFQNGTRDLDGPNKALKKRLLDFRQDHDTSSGLFFIYYGGHGSKDSRGRSEWMS